MCVLLALLWLWDVYEKLLEFYLSMKYRPVSPSPKKVHSSQDVSIVVPTIETDDDFARAMSLWLLSMPKEIIIVTIPSNLARIKQLVAPFEENANVIKIETVPHANKRDQVVCGVNLATGSVIALVDDDAYWNTGTIMDYFLACFEDEKVGGACGAQSADIPLARRNPAVITAWEVASLRSLYNQNTIQAVRYTADGSCWCLIGRTLFVRADIVKHPDFQHAFTNEFWGRNRLNTGDDVFITKWLQRTGWKIVIQNAPQAEITTEIMQDHKLAFQMVRWLRNAIQNIVRNLFIDPGFWTLYCIYPYTARKMVERLLRPVWCFLYLAAWLYTMFSAPRFGTLFAIWIIMGWAARYGQFLYRYPFCGYKIYAAFLLDHLYPIMDIYALFTLNREGWLTRNDENTGKDGE